MVTKEEILKASNLHTSRIHNITVFGSQVYGVADTSSDWDILVLANSSSPEREIKTDKLNIHILTIDRFKSQLEQHHIRALECIMAPDWAKIQEKHKFDFKIDLIKLRHSISHINSNSWVKSKKKINQGDYYLGIKSMFHSMRIAMFGSQIAKYGKIVDWSCANHIWEEIKSNEWTWVKLDNRFREYNNSLLSEFRKLASKF